MMDTTENDFQIRNIANFVTDKTKAIVLNTPNNPSGVVYSLETLEKLCKALDCQPGDILEYRKDEE